MKRYFDEYKAALVKHARARRAVVMAEGAMNDACDAHRRSMDARIETGAEVHRALEALNAALLKVSR